MRQVNAITRIDGTPYSYRLTGTSADPGYVNVSYIAIGDTFEGFIDANDTDASRGINGNFAACYCENVVGVSWPSPAP